MNWSFEYIVGKKKTSGALTLQESEKLLVHVEIANAGSPRFLGASSQTVLLFWRPLSVTRNLHDGTETYELPRQKLLSFHTSKSLHEGESDNLEFEVKEQDFALWSYSDSMKTIIPGRYELILRAAGVQLTSLLEVKSMVYAYSETSAL